MIIFMCQTTTISSNIIRLGTRSYRQRLEIVSFGRLPIARLQRLNKDLEDFYDSLYKEWNNITEDSYHLFAPQLKILIETLRELIDAYRSGSNHSIIGKEIERLKRNYSALVELQSDIVTFRVNLPKDESFSDLLAQASAAMNKLVI